MDHHYFFRVLAKLLAATPKAGDIDAAFDLLLESASKIIEHLLHIIDSCLCVAFAKDDLITLGGEIVYRKNILVSVNANEVAYGVIAFIAAWYT